eukprot:363880-Chlamydomonas_euryale.AAC.10
MGPSRRARARAATAIPPPAPAGPYSRTSAQVARPRITRRPGAPSTLEGCHRAHRAPPAVAAAAAAAAATAAAPSWRRTHTPGRTRAYAMAKAVKDVVAAAAGEKPKLKR